MIFIWEQLAAPLISKISLNHHTTPVRSRRGNRISQHTFLCLWICTPETKLKCYVVALRVSLHITISYRESVCYLLVSDQGPSQCLPLYCLTILENSIIFLMCVALSTAAA